jgi:hypothetical protein
MLKTSVTPAEIGAAIGDAMSINVLMRVIAGMLASSGLLDTDKPCTDIWKKAHQVSGVMPDALYIRHGLLKTAV